MTRGRKRAFDEDVALEAAMDVFWQKGYTGASLSDLTGKMGINKPSMYGTFGNKEALFVKATQRYIDNAVSIHSAFLFESGVPLAGRLKNYMKSVISMQCQSDQPRGCFIVLCQSEVAAGDMPEEAGRLLTESGGSLRTVLENIFREDPEAEALGLKENAAQKALFLATTLRGTASMARAGEPLSELEQVVGLSLKGIGIQ